MSQSFAIWLIIVYAAVTANLPFVLQRPLGWWPWSHRTGWSRATVVLVSLCWLVVLIGVGLGAYLWIRSSLVGFGDPLSVLMLLGKVLLLTGVVGLLMAWPGAGAAAAQAPLKRWWERLLELTALYLLVGALGLGLEAALGNPQPQGWPFYAVTACLYIIMAYPGYVFRYLLKRRRSVAAPFPERDLDTPT